MGRRLGTGRLAAIVLYILAALPASAQLTPLERTLQDVVQDIKAGRYDVAIESLERLERETQDNPAVRFYLAEALLNAGRPEDASRALVKFYKAYGDKSSQEIAPYLALVPRSANIADRIYGWQQPDTAGEDDSGLSDLLLGGLIASGATALALGAVAGIAAANVQDAVDLVENGSQVGDGDFDDEAAEANADAVEWKQTRDVAGIGAIVAGVVAAGLGVAYLMTDDGEPGVEVAPSVTSGGDVAGATMSIGWRF